MYWSKSTVTLNTPFKITLQIVNQKSINWYASTVQLKNNTSVMFFANISSHVVSDGKTRTFIHE